MSEQKRYHFCQNRQKKRLIGYQSILTKDHFNRIKNLDFLKSVAKAVQFCTKLTTHFSIFKGIKKALHFGRAFEISFSRPLF
ncbi:hypothetical protein BEL04_03115 [Mucilaginibacter sp. PPCGB 2223]|nr:hypothetical protein BEL04_03115 [Mucilaginibacter sp. PPCGB 2223]